jgi:hypothetical protein
VSVTITRAGEATNVVQESSELQGTRCGQGRCRPIVFLMRRSLWRGFETFA